jgi:small multidrug resistance pump
MFHWLLLFAATAFEVAGTTFMKLSEGLTHWWPATWMWLCYAASLAALTLSFKKLEMGIAYAIWGGLGTLCVAVVGVVHFDDELSTLKLVSLVLVAVGVVGLNLSSQRQ